MEPGLYLIDWQLQERNPARVQMCLQPVSACAAQKGYRSPHKTDLKLTLDLESNWEGVGV